MAGFRPSNPPPCTALVRRISLVGGDQTITWLCGLGGFFVGSVGNSFRQGQFYFLLTDSKNFMNCGPRAMSTWKKLLRTLCDDGNGVNLALPTSRMRRREWRYATSKFVACVCWIIGGWRSFLQGLDNWSWFRKVWPNVGYYKQVVTNCYWFCEPSVAMVVVRVPFAVFWGAFDLDAKAAYIYWLTVHLVTMPTPRWNPRF